MHVNRIARLGLILTGIAALGLANPTLAQTVIVPGGLATVDGDGNNIAPFDIGSLGSLRYQQVYNASAFSTLTAPALITTLFFRQNTGLSTSFSSTLPDIQIDLSTSRAVADGMSPIFANNVGANDTVVYNGALTLSSAATSPIGAKPFDIVIPLQTPFLYNPAAGNLVLDVRNRGGGTTDIFDAQEDLGDSVSRVYAFYTTISPPTSDSRDTLGLVTKFQFAPAPAVSVVPESSGLANLSGALLALGMGGLLMAVKKSKAKRTDAKKAIPLLGLVILAAFGLSALPAAAQTTVFTSFGPGNAFEPQHPYTVAGRSAAGGAQSIGVAFSPSDTGTLSEITVAYSHTSGTNDAHLYLTDSFSNLGKTAVSANLESFVFTPPASPGAVVVLPSVLHPVLTAGQTYYLYGLEPGNEINTWPVGAPALRGTSIASDLGGPYGAASTSLVPAVSIQSNVITPESSGLANLSGGLLALGVTSLLLHIRRRRVNPSV